MEKSELHPTVLYRLLLEYLPPMPLQSPGRAASLVSRVWRLNCTPECAPDLTSYGFKVHLKIHYRPVQMAVNNYNPNAQWGWRQRLLSSGQPGHIVRPSQNKIKYKKKSKYLPTNKYT